jgi:endonuclease/exonuclease/phosphatase family metal-dependent hydrolase
LFSTTSFGCKISADGSSSTSQAKSSDAEIKNAVISFASWNVQTFFDAQTEGSEYDDFKKSGNWSKDKYLVRLGRLCEVMTTLNPDVFVFQEIENEAVVQDIANQLAGKSWARSKKWDYAFFAKEAGSSIGCAVFSRYKISQVSTHSMDIRCQQTEQPQCRPVIQFCLEAGDKELWVLVNHWKSKLGTDERRIWRQWQESQNFARILQLLYISNSKTPAIILCGDFNQDASEFCCNFESSENVIFRGIASSSNSVKVTSPWFSQNGEYSTEIGSYYYQGEWERIDHIFAGGSARTIAFAPRAEEPWADSEKHPIAYRIYSGEGYSDHLPVMCKVTF